MVKVIPQTEVVERESLIALFLFWFSILVFIGVIIAFFFLNINTQKINASLKTVEEELEKISTSKQQNMKKQAYDYKEKLDIIPKLLERHVISTNVLSTIEKNIHPRVIFNSISLVLRDNKVILTGTTDDMISLAQQIRILEKEKPRIENVFIPNAERIEDGKIGFKIEIYFSPGALIIE